MKTMNFNQFEQTGHNLYKWGDNTVRYFRLFGTGITDNGCWIINPKMVGLKDINIKTGKDVYGAEIKMHDVTGTVSATKEYIKY
jgi:hypothetical protein